MVNNSMLNLDQQIPKELELILQKNRFNRMVL